MPWHADRHFTFTYTPLFFASAYTAVTHDLKIVWMQFSLTDYELRSEQVKGESLIKAAFGILHTDLVTNKAVQHHGHGM